MSLFPHNAPGIIRDVRNILEDPTTVTTPLGIPQNWNVIIEMNDGRGDLSYAIALYTPGGQYPLTDERLIHRYTEQVDINLYTSDGIYWVVDRWQSFHDPSTTQHPHAYVDGIHVIILQLPNFNDIQDEDDDGSSWGEGSVVSEGDFSEADTESVVSENGDSDDGPESIDEIQEILPASTVAYVHQTMNNDLIKRYIGLIRGYSEKKRWIRWYVFFANGNRLHTNNDELLHIARILKFAVWTCSQHSGIFEGLSYDDCVKHIVNAICEE